MSTGERELKLKKWSSIESLRFKYEYTDNAGSTRVSVVPLGMLNSLWGAGCQEVLTLEDFKRMTIEVGNRKAVITPVKSAGKGNRR